MKFARLLRGIVTCGSLNSYMVFKDAGSIDSFAGVASPSRLDLTRWFEAAHSGWARLSSRA